MVTGYREGCLADSGTGRITACLAHERGDGVLSYVQLAACSADIQGSGDEFAYSIWLYGLMTVWSDHDLHGNNASYIVLRLDLLMLAQSEKYIQFVPTPGN